MIPTCTNYLAKEFQPLPVRRKPKSVRKTLVQRVTVEVFTSLNPAELTVSSIKKPKAIVVYPRHTPHNAGAKESIESNFVISSLNGYTETLKTQPSRHTRLLPGKKELCLM